MNKEEERNLMGRLDSVISMYTVKILLQLKNLQQNKFKVAHKLCIFSIALMFHNMLIRPDLQNKILKHIPLYLSIQNMP